MLETKEFIALQKELLRHKFLYYEMSMPVITDFDYDMMERESFEMAQLLGFKADKYEGPEENEKHHVHWMIGFNENSYYNER